MVSDFSNKYNVLIFKVRHPKMILGLSDLEDEDSLQGG
jgi:hypothetical protein